MKPGRYRGMRSRTSSVPYLLAISQRSLPEASPLPALHLLHLTAQRKTADQGPRWYDKKLVRGTFLLVKTRTTKAAGEPLGLSVSSRRRTCTCRNRTSLQTVILSKTRLCAAIAVDLKHLCTDKVPSNHLPRPQILA